MAGGRPTDYTEDLGDLICQGISRKTALAKLCDNDDTLPTPRTVYSWLRKHPEFLQNYQEAKEDQADYHADEILEIADNPEIEPGHKKIMVDARRWSTSRFNTKKYGEKQTTVHEGTVTLEQLSEEEVRIRFAAAQANVNG